MMGRRVLFFMIVTLAVLLTPLSAYYWLDGAQAQTQTQTQAGKDNPRANYWRSVRQGMSGYTAVSGAEANVLIQNGGQNWRNLRNGPISRYGGWLLAATVLMLGVFFMLFGTNKIEGGRMGVTVERWPMLDRVVHWYVAILFIVLALTGLSLFYGRTVLIPVLGKDVFATYASFARTIHNYIGPCFIAGLILMMLIWVRHNIFNRVDMRWLAQAGGLTGHAHPHAGRFNAGEKIWFWVVVLIGLAVSAAGLVMDFPNYGQTRETMQWANIIHVSLSMVLIAGALAHIYIGTLGTEGAMEGMKAGRVDVQWAKQHHDLWYDELLAKGVEPQPVEAKQVEQTGRPSQVPS